MVFKAFIMKIKIGKRDEISSKDIFIVKFMFSKKATQIGEIFTVDLTLCSKCQINSEDFVNFRGFLRKYELYGFLLLENQTV